MNEFALITGIIVQDGAYDEPVKEMVSEYIKAAQRDEYVKKIMVTKLMAFISYYCQLSFK
ncbi:MAG: hypothetical protein OEW99_00250 [Gammaproteobacteria bacterium]|nr:hypothetical protein [Gammaproteobacteria bacterium]